MLLWGELAGGLLLYEALEDILSKQQQSNDLPTVVDRCKVYSVHDYIYIHNPPIIRPYIVLWSTTIEIRTLDPARSSCRSWSTPTTYPCGLWSYYHKALITYCDKNYILWYICGQPKARCKSIIDGYYVLLVICTRKPASLTARIQPGLMLAFDLHL